MALALSGAPAAALALARDAVELPALGGTLFGYASGLVPVGTVRQLEGSQALSSGNDGRLTFLLLGSDARGGGVERTDTIMVASLRGNSISVLSIPRDTARIPNPDGGTFSGRVNAILKQLVQGHSLEQGLASFERVIENLLQIEIDYYALVKFDGFQRLVEEIEPVSVDITRPIADSRYWDDPNKLSGVYFPTASNYDLYAWQPGANPLCNGLWRNQAQPIPSSYWCRRAMPFVRSRKGSSDFVRAHRQQNFVIASMRRVINRGGSSLDSLIARAAWERGKGTLATNIPLSFSNAIELYQRLSGSGVGLQVVLSPPKYSEHIPGGTAYELDLAAVRELTRQWFGGSDNPPVPPATTLPTVPPPGASAQPTPGPTATLGPGETAQPTPAPGTTAQPTNPVPSSVASGQPTSSAVAVVATPPPAGGSSSAPGAPQPAPSLAPVDELNSAPTGRGDLVTWLLVAGAAAFGAAALGLLWRWSRQRRESRP